MRAGELSVQFPCGSEWLTIHVWTFSAVFSVSLLLAIPAMGAEWTITSRLTVREVYTDNVALAPPGQEKSDFVTDINPGVSARGQGRRVNVSLDYSPQAIVRARDNSTNISHRLQAAAEAELVKERFFLDLRSTLAQTNLTNTGRRAEDNISRTGNRVDTFTYSVSPYLRQRFGRFADALVRYTYDEVINSGNALDSYSNKIDAQITSGSAFTRLTWSTAYSHQRTGYQDGSDGDDTEFERVEGTLRFLVNRKFSVFASGGIESNDFESIEENDGTFWRAGATWTPSRRTSFEASYGERFFGKSFAASMRHRSRRSVWTASFNEDTTTTREIQIERVLIAFVDPFGNPITDPLTGALIVIPIDIPTLTDEVIVRQRLEAAVALQGRRTSLSLGGFHEERDFQRSGDMETVWGANATLSRQLSRRSTVNISGTWQVTDFKDNVREDTRWSSAVSLRRRIGPSLDGLIEYRREEQDSNIAGNDFIENRITALLSMTF